MAEEDKPPDVALDDSISEMDGQTEAQRDEELDDTEAEEQILSEASGGNLIPTNETNRDQHSPRVVTNGEHNGKHDRTVSYPTIYKPVE